VEERPATTSRSLSIELDDATKADRLLRFLEAYECSARRDGEACVVVDDCESDSPGLATLIALVEEWRFAERIPEAVLELGGRRTILRTEV
jgi:hypothetical protein